MLFILQRNCFGRWSRSTLRSNVSEAGEPSRKKQRSCDHVFPRWKKKQLHAKRNGVRKSAHVTAKREMAQECVVVFVSTAIDASTEFAEFRTSFDVEILEEAAKCSEVEFHAAIMAPYTLNSDFCRCRVILVGVHCQLNPHSYVQTYTYWGKDVNYL